MPGVHPGLEHQLTALCCGSGYAASHSGEAPAAGELCDLDLWLQADPGCHMCSDEIGMSDNFQRLLVQVYAGQELSFECSLSPAMHIVNIPNDVAHCSAIVLVANSSES